MRSSETCTMQRTGIEAQQIIGNCNNPKKTTHNSQPWWWCGGGGHGGAASTEMSNENKTSIISQTKVHLDETSGKSATPHKSCMQNGTSGIMLPIMNNEYHSSSSQSELVSHSMACTSYPYHDACYGMMPHFGLQTLVHSQYSSSEILHPGRMALPLQMAEEPVYVNAKQYHGILRRRQSRARAEVEKKIISVRKPYLHESRHLHAMRRERGRGGRFASKKKQGTASSTDEQPSNVTSGRRSSVSLSSESAASSKLSFININAADSYQTNDHHRQVAAEASDIGNSTIAGSCFQTHQGSILHLSAYI